MIHNNTENNFHSPNLPRTERIKILFNLRLKLLCNNEWNFSKIYDKQIVQTN